MEKKYTGRTYHEFEIGESFETPGRTVTEAMIGAYAGLSGDFNPLHMDAEFCKSLPLGQRMAHGGLTFTISAGLFNRYVDGTCIAFLELHYRYTKAVLIGDTLSVRIAVNEKKLTSKGKGIVTFGVTTVNQRGEPVLEGEWTLMVEA